jgi:hypothetical protein
MPTNLPGEGGNKPNPPPLVNPNAPKPVIPSSWDDWGRQAAAMFQLFSERGSAAVASFQAWLAVERAKK